MDRRISYLDALPRLDDFMGFQVDALYALGYLAQATLGGDAKVVDGLVAAATIPASMHITIGPGSIYSMQTVDARAYGTLGTDKNSVVKQGILKAPKTLTITAPATSGYSQVYLVQASYADTDGGLAVLPYYNSANPAQPLSGLNNNGQAQYTIRQGVLTISLKAGAAAATGSQVAPSADSGAVALYTITVSNSTTSVASNMIARAAGAPFIDLKLPGVPAAIQAQSDNYVSTVGGTANAITLTPSLPFAGLSKLVGVPLRFLTTATNTGAVRINVSGLGAKPLTWSDGTALVAGDLPTGTLAQVMYDGARFVLSLALGPAQVRALTSWASRKAVYTGAGSYTYTVPSANRADRLTDIEVELQAAGGAGGASGDGSSGGIAGNIGAGGGGGAFAKKKITGLTPGSTIPITLGAPGVGATGAAGTDASNASFGAYFTLGGGKGGAFGSATRAIGGAGGALVSGSVDELYIGASGGFSGPNSATVTASDVITGYGRGGLSHEGFVPLNETGAAGIGYGSGGTGASGGSGLKGGDGAPPKCIIRA